MMRVEQALEVLGLSADELTEQAVRYAFAARVREVHPDTSLESSRDAASQIDTLRMARGLLMTHLATSGTACTACDGRGNVPGRLGVIQCTRCAGQGVIT